MAFRYNHVVDAAHDHTALSVDDAALPALYQSWTEIAPGKGRRQPPPEYRDRTLYDKSQPLILRQAITRTLGRRLAFPGEGLKGVEMDPEQNVLVCPYSHELMLKELFLELAQPNGIIYAPGGFNPHITNLTKQFPHTVDPEQRLRVVSPSTPSLDRSIKPDLLQMKKELEHYRSAGELCAIYFTQPAHGAIEGYQYPTLEAMARIFAEQDVPIICDMTFDQLASDYIPLPTVEFVSSTGENIHMYNKTYTVMSNVYGHNGKGPTGFGALVSGNTEFLQEFRKKRLTIAFQRETTHLAYAVMSHTTNSYLQKNRGMMRLQQEEAREYLSEINHQLGGPATWALGNPEGLYTTVIINPELLAQNSIYSSRQLADRARVNIGVETIATEHLGIPQTGLCFNNFAPTLEDNLSGQNRDALHQELFRRLHYLVADMAYSPSKI